MRIMLVEWEDTRFQTNGWRSRDSIKEMVPAQCVSIGILEENSQDYIHIIPNISERDGAQVITIPKRDIKRIRRLKIERGSND